VALFASVPDSEDALDSDRVIYLPSTVSEAAVFIREVLEEYAFTGCPLWPVVPSSTRHSSPAKLTSSESLSSLGTPPYMGMVLRWWANVDGKVIIGTLPDSDDMRHQIRREALSGVLALEAAALEVDLSDAFVILHNDAIGALSAFQKGSFSFTFLQQCAMRSCLIQRRALPDATPTRAWPCAGGELMITPVPVRWRWPDQ
jgi:hypothetical protein